MDQYTISRADRAILRIFNECSLMSPNGWSMSKTLQSGALCSNTSHKLQYERYQLTAKIAAYV